MTHLENDISDKSLTKQGNLFFKRVHPFIQAETPMIISRGILHKFLSNPSLFDAIPDFLHRVITCFQIGHNESYIESVGSVLKHQNPPQRNISLVNLDMELSVAWNGPEIPHCDDIVKETLDHLHGANQWHFVRTSDGTRLKFYRVSEAIDRLQNEPMKVFL